MMILKKSTMALLSSILIVFTACSSTRPPLQDLSIAKMAVLDAGEIKEDTEAVKYFQKAKEELIEAQKMMQDKSYDKAKFFAQKATADARVAKIKASNYALIKQINILDLELKKVKKEFVTIDENQGE